MIKRVRGNDLKLGIDLKKMVLTDGTQSVTNFVPGEKDVVSAKLYKPGVSTDYKVTMDGSTAKIVDHGSLTPGAYSVEVKILTEDGERLRAADRNVLEIVEYNAEADIDGIVLDAEETVQLQATFYEVAGTVTEGMSEAQVRALLASYIKTTDADARYQAKGTYLTAHQSLEAYLTKALAASTYQPKGTYLTEHQSLVGYLTKVLADTLYQPVGNYLTAHQSLADYLTKTLAEQTYQPKGTYLTSHQSLADYLKSADAQALYQPKGTYLTAHQSLEAYLTKALAASTYQPKGTYLTSHQDISGKMDKEEIIAMTASTATIDTGKFYKWGTAGAMLDISLNASSDSGHMGEYTFQFTAGASTALVLPADVMWASSKEPTIVAGNIYEVSIVDNCAAYLEFTPYDD